MCVTNILKFYSSIDSYSTSYSDPTEMSGKSADLDDVFVEVGDFGRYQIITFVLLIALNILSGTSTVNYMISAGPLEYRYGFSFFFRSVFCVVSSLICSIVFSCSF